MCIIDITGNMPLAVSWRFAAWTVTPSKWPCVSTTIWRFLPLIFFPTINSTLMAGTSSLDALGIDDRIRWLWILTFIYPGYFHKPVQNPVPQARQSCSAVKGVDSEMWRKIMWQQPPLASCFNQVKHRVYQFPFWPFIYPQTCELWLYCFPLGIS